MSFEVSKKEMLQRLEHEFRLLAEVVDQFIQEQALKPGLLGSWSLKDFLAHLIAHEQRALAELQAAQQGQFFPIDHTGIHSFNDGAVFGCRMFDFAILRHAWEESYRAVYFVVASIPEAEFAPVSLTVQHLEDSVDGALANNTYAHYAEHRPRVKQWLQKLQNQVD
jgi:hypothetical protein